MSSYATIIETKASAGGARRPAHRPERHPDWSPVPFELDGGARGSPCRRGQPRPASSGSLAGLRVGFDVQVHSADADGLRLNADGPVAIDVDYGVASSPAPAARSGAVSLRRARGLGGRVIGKATEALLAGGALERATTRIARAAEDAATGAVPA